MRHRKQSASKIRAAEADRQSRSSKLREALKEYLEADKLPDGKLTIETSACAAGVSPSTFKRRLLVLRSGTATLDETELELGGQPRVFDDKHEQVLLDVLTLRGKLRYPMTRPELSQLIATYAVIVGADDPGIKVPSSWTKNWRTSRIYVRDFIERHKDVIRVRRSHSLTHHRHMFTTEVCFIVVLF